MQKNTLNAYHESLNRAIIYIENNLDNKILLKDVSREAHLSEFHFHRIFKTLTGETVKDLLVRLKLDKAANQLQYSQKEIHQIALDCGYDNHETFIRAFKSYFQSTPKEYRISIQKNTIEKQQYYKDNNATLSQLKLEEPIIKTIPDLHLAFLRHTGSYAEVAKSFQNLMLWAAKNLILKLKPTTIGIVHDNPNITAEENIRFDACVLLTKSFNPEGKFAYKLIKGGKFAIFRYKGTYDSFYEVYDYIYNVCLFERKLLLEDKPALEWYIKSPPYYKPNNYVTDFYVPIK